VGRFGSNSVVRPYACRVCLHFDHLRIGEPEQTCDATYAVELIALKLEVFFGKKSFAKGHAP